MEAEHKVILQEQHVYLSENVEYNEICDFLIRDGLLSRDKHEELNSEKTNRAKVRELLGYLTRCGPNAFPKFVNIFREIDPPRHDIAEKLCPENYDTVDAPTNNALFEVRGRGFRQPSQHPPSPTPNIFSRPQVMDTEPSNQQCAALLGNGHSGARVIQPQQPKQEAAADKGLSDVTIHHDISPPSNWWDTALTSEQRAMACRDKLFAKLSTKVPNIVLLAVHLDFSTGEREQIQHGNPYSVPNQVLELLTRWRKRTAHPSVEILVQALEEAHVCDSAVKQQIMDFCNAKYS